jgi:redox-sensing transcriptional repressor
VVVRRLPIYARALEHLAAASERVISSGRLGALVGVSADQIRKDLSYFGEFGRKGAGYRVDALAATIRGILGLDQERRLAVVGLGRLGRALAAYPGFVDRGFRVVALFDRDPAVVGQEIASLRVLPMESLGEVLAREGVTVGIVAVPAEQAQAVTDLLVASGVRALLNYAPITVATPPSVRVGDVDPVVALQSLAYYLKAGEPSEQAS